ncbi:MAG: gliding motility-associated C-terminal domain-containing protein, partial [Bacteroidota bacterium]
GNPTTFSNITADTFFLPVSNTGVYQIGNLIADGCPGSVNGEGQVLFVEIDTDFDIDSISCFGDANAAISLNPVGGTGVYDYVWTHDIALNADSIGGLDIGMYTAFISDSNGCVDTISVTIDQPPLLELMVDTLALFADCVTGGALQANGSGGTGAYSFLWSDGETSSLNNNLAPGNYDLELRDENNCLASSSIAILADTLSPTLLLTVSDSLDCGTPSVMVDASGSSQGMNFTYQWTDPNGMIITPPDPLLFDAAEAGTYTLNITNTDNSCSQTDSLEVIQLADGLTVNLGGDTDLNCFQPDGQLFFLDSMPDFSATWELLDGTVLATGVNNLTVSEPNTYVLLVDQLSNGCVGRDTIVVMADQDAPILSLSNTPDSLDCDISQVLVDVEISNGSGNYSYNWDGPAGGIVGSTNGQDVEGSLPGLYQLIATDADNGCQDTLTYEIIQDQSDLVIDPLPDTTLTCDVLAIDYTASSPNTGNLQFEWFDAMNNSIALSPDVTFTQTGVYTLQLTDLDNNCSQTAALEVTADTLRPAVTALLPDELTCVNDSVTLAIEPGLPDYSVRWRTAMGDVLSSDTWTQEVGDGGGYMLTVTDDRNGCRTVVIFEVLSDTVAPVITFDLADTLTCVTNEVDLSPSMITGSGTYEYLWAGPVGGIVGSVDQMQITAVEAGSYDLTVTDAQNGCVDSMQTIVEVDRVDPVLSVLNDTLINCFNPEILLSASSSSAGDLDFEWFDDQGMSLAQGPDLMVDEQGDYRVVLTNTRNGCTDELSLNVMDDSILPTAEAGADVTIDCDNNTATLTGTEGPNNWTPTWLDANGMVLSTGEWTLMTSAPGMYTLSVLDTANGCEASDEAEVQIDQNFPVATVGTLNQVDCFSNSATIDASGSSQGTNFTYQVVNDNGNVVLQPSGLFFDLSNPGSYQFVVTNTDNNCSAAADFTVTQTEPSISSLEVSDIPCGASSGTIIFAEVTDGTPPYLYSIDNGNSFSADPIFSGLEPGNYDLVVQDVNGCEAGSSAFITQALGVELSLPEQVELDFLEVFTLEPLLLNVNPNELVEIKWSGSNELSCQDCLNPIFTATETTRILISVTDENGCTAEATILLLVDQTVPIFIPNAFSPDGLDGANDFFTVYADAAQVLEVRQINIFDRWGGLVFSKNNLPINAPSEGWDGTQNGTILNSGVYVYWVEVILQTGESKIMEGDVLLLR